MISEKPITPTWKRWVSQIFFGLWTVLFLLFAYWQRNDPDPKVWISIYLFAAAMCALAMIDIFSVPLLFLVALTCFIGGLYFFPDSISGWIVQEWQQADLSMKTVEMEEARESFGLLITSGIMGIATYAGWRRRRHRKGD